VVAIKDAIYQIAINIVSGERISGSETDFNATVFPAPPQAISTMFLRAVTQICY
jgi:hypothetical protein